MVLSAVHSAFDVAVPVPYCQSVSAQMEGIESFRRRNGCVCASYGIVAVVGVIGGSQPTKAKPLALIQGNGRPLSSVGFIQILTDRMGSAVLWLLVYVWI